VKRLVTGTGRQGTSWDVRGFQLGGAIGACVDPHPLRVQDYEQMVLVKRPTTALVRAHQLKVPVIYDVVDAWQRDLVGGGTRADCLRWLARTIDIIRPAAIVAATSVMAEDCRHITDLPVLALPHHARPEQKINPIREQIKTVGYEGLPIYLGWWAEFMAKECSRRGWSWVVNPPSLADLDIVVAVRDRPGYAPRHWKSNIKLANAQGSGTPCIINREIGYWDTMTGPEIRAETREEMVAALDQLTEWGQSGRKEMAKTMREGAPRLRDIARTYKAWLDEVACVVSS
jgi:hypothetical protein